MEQHVSLSAQAVQILLTLSHGPRHGYGIKLDIEARTGGRMVLGSGTLYQAIQRLERRGLIADTDPDPDDDPRRGRSYRIEPAGREVLRSELARMESIVTYARRHALFSDSEVRP